MEQVEEAKLRLVNTCVPALNAAHQARNLDLQVDQTLGDDDFKVEVETKIVSIKQATDALLKFARDINHETELYRQLTESLSDPQQSADARQSYLDTLNGNRGPVQVVNAINEEVSRLHSEKSRLQGHLDAVVARISLQNSSATPTNTSTLRATAMLPTLNDLLKQTPSQTSSPTPIGNTVSTNIRPHSSISHLLPRTDLPKFDGSYGNWQTFIDTFLAIVDSAPIQNVEKLTILLSYLTGSARHSVAGYSVTNDNYPIVLQVLKDRYGNKEQLVWELNAELKNLPPSGGGLHSTRKTFDEIDRILRLLEAQGQDINHEQMRLLVEEKMPHWLRLELEELKLLYRGAWTINVFREAVQNKLRMRERVQNYSRASPTTNPNNESRGHQPPGQHQGHRQPGSEFDQELRPSAAFMAGTTKQPHCYLCDKPNHWTTDCCTYPEPDGRKNRAKQLNLCLKCLSKEHFAKDCTSKRNCFYCRKPHNSAFCFERSRSNPSLTQQRTTFSPANTKQPTKEQEPEIQHSNTSKPTQNEIRIVGAVTDMRTIEKPIDSGMLGNEVPKWAFATANNDPEISLFTCKTVVASTLGRQTSKATFLIDTAAQLSLISIDMARKLRLKQVGTKPCRLSTLTKSHRKTEYLPVFEILVQKTGGKHMLMHLIGRKKLPSIKVAYVLNPPGELENKSFKPVLAKFSFMSPDILVGADTYSLFHVSPVRVLSSGATVLSSVIGYAILGPLPTHSNDYKRHNYCAFLLTNLQPPMLRHRDPLLLEGRDPQGLREPAEDFRNDSTYTQWLEVFTNYARNESGASDNRLSNYSQTEFRRHKNYKQANRRLRRKRQSQTRADKREWLDKHCCVRFRCRTGKTCVGFKFVSDSSDDELPDDPKQCKCTCCNRPNFKGGFGLKWALSAALFPKMLHLRETEMHSSQCKHVSKPQKPQVQNSEPVLVRKAKKQRTLLSKTLLPLFTFALLGTLSSGETIQHQAALNSSKDQTQNNDSRHALVPSNIAAIVALTLFVSVIYARHLWQRLAKSSDARELHEWMQSFKNDLSSENASRSGFFSSLSPELKRRLKTQTQIKRRLASKERKQLQRWRKYRQDHCCREKRCRIGWTCSSIIFTDSEDSDDECTRKACKCIKCYRTPKFAGFGLKWILKRQKERMEERTS